MCRTKLQSARSVAGFVLLHVPGLVAVFIALFLCDAAYGQTLPTKKYAALNHALVAAIKNRDAAGVRKLMRQGADINAAGAVGDGHDADYPGSNTPALMLATLNADADTVAALIEGSGSQWKKFGPSCLIAACGYGYLQTARVLLTHGVDPNISIGYSPLYVTAAGASDSDAADRAEFIKQLLTAGAKVNALAQDGATPLMGAADSGSEEITRLLLDHGADIRIKDKKGKTARDHAAATSHPAIVALLDQAAQQPKRPAKPHH